MTITDQDISNYESRTAEFKYQPGLQDCLPVCVKNALSELAHRHDKKQIEYTESEIKDMSDFDPELGTTGKHIVPNLSAELEEYGYTLKDQRNCTIDELGNIAQKNSASLPVVSLSPEYFDEIREWDPRGGKRGKNRTHAVVIFKVNSDEVLFFDPYGKMQLRTGARNQPKRRLPQRKFWNLWNTEKSWPRWILWIDRLQRTTLEHFQED